MPKFFNVITFQYTTCLRNHRTGAEGGLARRTCPLLCSQIHEGPPSVVGPPCDDSLTTSLCIEIATETRQLWISVHFLYNFCCSSKIQSKCYTDLGVISYLMNCHFSFVIKQSRYFQTKFQIIVKHQATSHAQCESII